RDAVGGLEVTVGSSPQPLGSRSQLGRDLGHGLVVGGANLRRCQVVTAGDVYGKGDVVRREGHDPAEDDAVVERRHLLDRALDGVDVHRRAGASPYDVIVLFAADRQRLTKRWSPLAQRLTVAGRLWVCWPKRTSGLQTDLSENDVREYGLTEGLVDVKVCAID